MLSIQNILKYKIFNFMVGLIKMISIDYIMTVKINKNKLVEF